MAHQHMLKIFQSLQKPSSYPSYILNARSLTAACEYIISESGLSFYIGMFVSNYMIIALTNMYCFTKFGIAINRFMQIHLNIKYDLYWNANKTRKLLLAFFIMLKLS